MNLRAPLCDHFDFGQAEGVETPPLRCMTFITIFFFFFFFFGSPFRIFPHLVCFFFEFFFSRIVSPAACPVRPGALETHNEFRALPSFFPSVSPSVCSGSLNTHHPFILYVCSRYLSYPPVVYHFFSFSVPVFPLIVRFPPAEHGTCICVPHTSYHIISYIILYYTSLHGFFGCEAPIPSVFGLLVFSFVYTDSPEGADSCNEYITIIFITSIVRFTL